MFKLLLSGLGISLLAYFLICIALVIAQNRLIFQPSKIVANTPQTMGIEYQEVWIGVRTWQGKTERLHAWWLPGKKEDGLVLLHLHGNGGNMSYNLNTLATYHELGFSVLSIDYRGYGRSEGNFPTEAEVYRDAQGAWDYLVKTKGILPRNIFLYGHSLGGAIAIDLAIRQPQVAGVIADNTFTSMRAMVDYLPLYRFFPADLLLRERFDSLGKLRLLRSPLLLIHGANDRTVPPSMGEVLYKQATVLKKLVIVPFGSHNDLITVDGETYTRAVTDFIVSVRKHQRQELLMSD
ncbi:MAG: alpha/beta hydrolase [Chlorogloea purpurea SAG 13.99]|nr:alpha/beta hydrolase [Chlorogloea purpurea SAG 13.99]